jgi:hypothetical protein
MLMVNLPLMLISRGIFLVAFYLNYFRFKDKDVISKNSRLFSNKEKLYFVLRNAIIIALGILNLYIAIFISIYSILCAIIHTKNIGNRLKLPYLEIIGTLLYYVVPVLFIISFLFDDLFTLFPLGLSLLLFYFWGENYSNFSLEERRKKRLISILPHWAYYAIVIILALIPSIAFIGLAVGGLDFVIWGSHISTNTFNFMLMFLINLPIILITRIIYFYTLYYKDSRAEDSIVVSMKDKQWLIIKNIIIIFVSFFFIYGSIFFGVYSLIVSASILNEMKKNGKSLKTNILLIISYTLIPLILVLAIVFYFLIGTSMFYILTNVAVSQSILIAISGGLSIPLYLYHKKQFGKFSLKGFI